MELQLFVAVAMATTLAVYALRDGAPLSVCTSLTPAHGTAQTGDSPYSIDLPDAVTMYTDGTKIAVTINGTFAGVLLQARASGSMDPVGTFDSPATDSHLKLSACGGIAGSAITHSIQTDKTDSVVMWNPPSTNVGDIEFIATVAEAKLMWWLDNKSSKLTSDPSNPTAAPQTTTTETTNAGSQLQGSSGSVWFYLMELTLTVVYVIGL